MAPNTTVSPLTVPDTTPTLKHAVPRIVTSPVSEEPDCVRRAVNEPPAEYRVLSQVPSQRPVRSLGDVTASLAIARPLLLSPPLPSYPFPATVQHTANIIGTISPHTDRFASVICPRPVSFHVECWIAIPDPSAVNFGFPKRTLRYKGALRGHLPCLKGECRSEGGASQEKQLV
jgi:hypothetical protein